MDLERPKRTNAPMKPVVEDKLKLAAEAFAIKVFENPDIYKEHPGVLNAAVSIYEHSLENGTLTPIQNFN